VCRKIQYINLYTPKTIRSKGSEKSVFKTLNITIYGFYWYFPNFNSRKVVLDIFLVQNIFFLVIYSYIVHKKSPTYVNGSARYFYMSISINKIYEPKDLFPMKVFYKKYVLFITNIFMFTLSL
jgi:hypothetical protein